MAVAWMADNLIVIITTSGDEHHEDATRRGPTTPRGAQEGVSAPLITIFHLLNEIMLITYIALCKKEIYKD